MNQMWKIVALLYSPWRFGIKFLKYFLYIYLLFKIIQEKNLKTPQFYSLKIYFFGTN